MTFYRNKSRIFGLFAVLLTGFSQSVLANDAVINVQGSGALEVTPNAYSVTFVVEEEGDTVSKLNGQLNADLRQVVQFLLSQNMLCLLPLPSCLHLYQSPV